MKRVLDFMRSFLGNAKRRLIVIIILVLVLVIAVLGTYIGISVRKEPESVISLSSTLVDALDVDELSGSSFIYNGIADIYDSKGEKVRYNVRYNATVKVGIQMHEIKVEEDAERKTLKITLPNIIIQSVSVDPAYIDFLPDNAKIDLKTVLSTCREDARWEATESDELIEAAKENLRTVVEALAMPLIEGTGYTLEW